MNPNFKKIKRLKITDIKHNDDGTTTLIFDLDDDFINWFKEREGLKRFSHKRFNLFVQEAISNHLKADDNFDGIVGEIVAEE